MNAAKWLLAIALGSAHAIACAAGFPDGSARLTSDALSQAVAGKVFSVKTSQGPYWRWQFKSDGLFALTIGSFADEGKWSSKESSLCTEGKKIKFSCNEVRALGSDLYLLRDSGEVVKLEVQ